MNGEQAQSAVNCYDSHMGKAAAYALTPESRARFVRMGLIRLPAVPTRARSCSRLTPQERQEIAAMVIAGWPKKAVARRYNVTPMTVTRLMAKRAATRINARGSDAALAERTNAEAAGATSAKEP